MSTARSRLLTVTIMSAAALAAVLWNDPARKALTFDNQIYFYSAVRAADGVPPHVSLVDHKHQLSTLVSGWAIRAGRLFGLDDIHSARTVSVVAGVTTVACVTWLGAAITGSAAGGLLAGTAMLVFPGYLMQAAMGVRPKVFMAAFMMLAIVQYARRQPLTSGVAAAAAFLCWQPALLVMAALAAVTLPARSRWRDLGLLLAGFAITVAAYEAYFAARGALHTQIEQSYLLPANVGSYPYPPLWESLRFFVVMGFGQRVDSSAALPVVLLLVLAAWATWCVLHPVRAWQAVEEHRALMGTAACAVPATAFTLLTHQGYPDMFFVEPFIAIAVATPVASLASLLDRRVGRVGGALLVVGFLAWFANLYVWRRTVFAHAGIHVSHQRDLARQLDLLYEEYGSVWAIGCPHLLAYDRRENFLPYGLLIDSKVRALMTRGVEPADFRPLRDGHLPGVILEARGGVRTAFPAMPRYYERLKNLSFERQGIRVWVLRRLPPGAPRPSDRLP